MNQVIYCLFCFCITLNIIGMQPEISSRHKKNIQIKTLDGQFCMLPQWKIEASRLLHTQQELSAFKEKCLIEHLYPLTLKTISKEQLNFFSQALETHNFIEYYNKLTPEKKRLLINLAGENQLNSPILTIQLAMQYFDCNILQLINLCFASEIKAVHDSLRRSLIIHNLTLGEYKQNTVDYDNNGYVAIKNNGEYSYLPMLLRDKYQGYTASIPLLLKNQEYLLDNIKSKNKQETYYITPIEPINDSNSDKNPHKKNIWLNSKQTKTSEIKKVLEHTNEINKIVFSNDGKYLITSSFNPQSELIITYLEQEDEKLAFSHRFLKEHSGEIGAICFNDTSTILAVGSENGIQLLNPKTLSLIKKLDLPADGWIVDFLQFNKAGTLLATSIHLQNHMRYIIQLYDTRKIDSIVAIAHVEKTIEQVQALEFYPDNSLIITGTDHVVIIDGLGNIIMETEMMPRDDARFSVQTAVLIPDIGMLVTARATDEKYCDTKIWDMRSKKIIATLLLNAIKVNGIGVSKNGQSIITTHRNCIMTQTDLYSTNITDSLAWIKNSPDLIQKYLLLRLHRARTINSEVDLDPNSIEHKILHALPTAPCNVQKLIQTHLLKKHS